MQLERHVGIKAGGRKVEGGMNRQEAARQAGMVLGGQK
jgi:hypothetical protein